MNDQDDDEASAQVSPGVAIPGCESPRLDLSHADREPSHPLTRDRRTAAVAYRVLQEVWLEAQHAYWTRRAAALEAARPRPDDFHGQASHAELDARYRRLAGAARACRNRAEFEAASRAEFRNTLVDLGRSA